MVYDYERNIVELIHPSNPLNEPLSKRTINMVYTVVYQCNHTKVTKDEDKIILPQHLLGLLHSYVAYKIFSNMNTESAVSNSAKLFQEYQLGIQKIKQESLVEPENKPLNNKFKGACRIHVHHQTALQPCQREPCECKRFRTASVLSS